MSFRECVVCNSNENSKYHCSLDGSDYLICDSCGLIYVDQLETTGKIYTAYSGGMIKSLRRKLFAPIRKLHHVSDFEYSMGRATKIAEFATRHATTKGGKYLDIGCNKGFLIAAGMQLGWDVYGAEIVPELTVPFGNSYKEYRDHLYAGRFCDVRPHLDENMFDLITAIDVVEHFEDPLADFQGIYDVLKPGGVFVVQTPEAACDQAKELMEKWGALKPLEHINLFTSKNLGEFSRRFGFEQYEVFEPFEEADGNFVAVMKKPL